MSSTPRLVTAPHELDAHLIFGSAPGDDGIELDPYLAFLRVIRENGGSKRYTLEFRGMKVSGNLYYQDSGGIGELRHPDADQIETVREPRISWEVVDDDDPIGECSGNFHIRPRDPDMRTHDGKRMNVPRDLIGVDVRAQGSNLDQGLYLNLFRAIAAELGIASRYFDDLHEYSNVADAARYVRVVRSESGPVHAVDGVLARIGNLLANDREGYRKHVADDRGAPGFYHSATVGSKRAGELVDGHRLAKEVKHYLPRKPDAFDPDHPLYHPKVEVSFQQKQNDDGTIPWVDLHELEQELDETLLNVLRWSGLPTTDGEQNRELDDVYFPDQYFAIETDHRSLTLTRDPTPSIRNNQESVVVKHLRDGLDGSKFAIVEQLVADGGQHDPQELADETGYHLSTIYRAMKRMPELVEHQYGDVALKSPYIAEQLVDAIEHAETAVASAVETGANALAFAADELESSSLVKWLRAHSVDVLPDENGELTLRVGDRSLSSKEELRAALRKGLLRWKNAGRDPARFQRASVRANLRGQPIVLTVAFPGRGPKGDRTRVPTG